MGDFGDGGNVRDIVFGVRNGLNVNRAGVFINLFGDVGWLITLNPFDVDVEFLHVNTELVVRPAVEP